MGFDSDLGARLSEGPALLSAIYRAWRAIGPAGGSARTTQSLMTRRLTGRSGLMTGIAP